MFDTVDINYNAYSVEQVVDADENTVVLQESVSDNTSTEHKKQEMSENLQDISSVIKPLGDAIGDIVIRVVLLCLVSVTVIRVTYFIIHCFFGW